ncbi:MAG TPA: ATP-binding protein, partial [Saprospiraceae bacterium]
NQGANTSTALRYFTSSEDFIIRWTCDIVEDRIGQLWFGSTTGMMKLTSPKTGERLTFQHYSGKQGFTDAFVMCITPDSKGNIWFGTFGGGLIQAKLSASGDIEEFIHFTEDQGFPANYIIAVIEDDEGNLWVETDINGVSYFKLNPDRRSGTLTVYSEREGLLSQQLSSMYLDPKGDLWLGTERNGLCQFVLSDAKGEQKFNAFTKNQGLTDDNIREIIPFPGNGPDRPFWVTTKNGLNLVQPHNSNESKTTLFSFGRTEGIKHTGFTYRNGNIDHNGKIWLGTEQGLQVLSLNTFKTSNSIPKPFLRQIHVNERAINYHHLPDSLKRSISFKQTNLYENLPIAPTFSYKSNHLTFSFAATDWSDPYKLQYSYKIDGLNETWSTPSAESKAEYRNLPSGTFTFKVRAIGESQIWSEPFEYKFTIRPPWWYSWWAIVMYTCFGGFIVYRTYRFQLNRKLEIAEKQRLVELDQIKNRLYTNITHEFRTPLTLIHGPVTQALSKNTVLEQKDIQSIHRQSERLQQLINQMLQLQKLEAGMLKPHYAYGEIIQVLRNLFGSFETWAKDKNISMLFSSSLQEVYMDFDQEKLTQIISNLVSNAIKHTPRGGKVAMVINPSSSADFLLINISDTGTGISEEDLPYIFDRFYQSKRASSGGTGIGLALVKNLTDLLGGQISVESKLDSGSTFKLSLPITKRTHKPAEAVPATEVSVHEAHDEEINFITPQHVIPGKPIVLIVEDHPEVLQYVASCLADEYTILSAKDGNEGLRLAYERVPDLIISDVMMPGKDGFELCNILKTDIQTSHIPIILLTGRGDHEAMMEGIGRGADAYVTKPFDPEELLLRVRKLLELRSTLSQYYRQHATTQNPETIQQSSAKENEFLQKIRAFVEEHLNDSRFNMDMLCHQMAMSHPQLHRKITALTGESTGKFVRSVRLAKALELLRHSDLTISEIAYETGFSEPGYFTKVFSKEFNSSPTEYRSGMSG